MHNTIGKMLHSRSLELTHVEKFNFIPTEQLAVYFFTSQIFSGKKDILNVGEEGKKVRHSSYYF